MSDEEKRVRDRWSWIGLCVLLGGYQLLKTNIDEAGLNVAEWSLQRMRFGAAAATVLTLIALFLLKRLWQRRVARRRAVFK